MNFKCDHYPEEVLYVCTCNDFLCEKCRGFHEQLHETRREKFRLRDIHSVRDETIQKMQKYMSELDSKLKDTRRYKQDIASSKQFTEGFQLIERAQAEIKKLINAFFKVLEDDFESKSHAVKAEYEHNLHQVESKLTYTIETFQELFQGLRNTKKTALWQKTLDVALNFDFQTEMTKIHGEIQAAIEEKFYISVNPKCQDAILEQLHNYIQIMTEDAKSSKRSSFGGENLLPNDIVTPQPNDEEVYKNKEPNMDIIIEDLNFSKSPGIRPTSQAYDGFQITLGDYFHPECTNKLLHFFEGGSKNLYLIPLQEMASESPRCHKVELNIKTEIPFRHRSIVTPYGEIFLTGGVRGEEELAYTFKLNFVNGALLPKRLMPNPRKSHGLCYMNGYLYAIGGYNATFGVLPFCEKYDIVHDKWIEIAPLNYRTSSPSVCPFNNRYIFKFWGLEGSLKVSDQIEKYDVEKDQWSIFQIRLGDNSGLNSNSFKTLWLSASCQLNENDIIVFGGCDENNQGSKQSFLAEIIQGKDQKGEMICNLRKRNTLPLPYAAGFWNSQCIIHEGKMYSIQNELVESDPSKAYEDRRNLLVFDGLAWKAFNV